MAFINEKKYWLKALLACGIIVCFIGLRIMPLQAASSNAQLSSVSFDMGQLNYEFTAGRTYYTLSLPKDAVNVEVTAKAQDANAKVSIAGNKNIQAAHATGKIVITVIAADGSKKWYTFALKFDGKAETSVPTTTPKVTTTTPKGTITTPVVTTTTPKGTTITTPDTSVIVDTSISTSSTTTSPIPDEVKLRLLAIKGYELNQSFDKDIYEYSVIINENPANLEVDAVAIEETALIALDRNNSRIIVTVSLQQDAAKYTINLKKISKLEVNSSMISVLKNMMIAIILLVIAIVLFVLSKKAKSSLGH